MLGFDLLSVESFSKIFDILQIYGARKTKKAGLDYRH